ncbi:MAG TPA: ABC transporter ATP-binding protein [Niabella sp.]|nr:ABC transporter ATP-binding protein [Chitinophagaceae bacterium]HRN48257.1 ABC transporter ATP-binding protein [Niabella sp.]HRO84519.1 ABC transporter ATP-binding protein [Niabella sp.]
MAVLTVQNITKKFPRVKALDNVSFEVPQGSVFGILGPNGSGKTTLLGIIMDVLKASEGQYLWNGEAGNAQQRRKVGTLLETPNFYHYLSAEKNLEIAAAIKGYPKDDIERVLKIVNLYERKDSSFSTFSLGMKQRLAIASTLLGNPSTLVFDEPTNGLDPAGIAEIRRLIKNLSEQGKTIIMASHILDEVEKVCSHVAILQKGVLKTSGTVSEVLANNEEDEQIIEISAANLDQLRELVTTFPGVNKISGNNGVLQIYCKNEITPESINRQCYSQNIILSHLSVRRKNLETRFLEITDENKPVL